MIKKLILSSFFLIAVFSFCLFYYVRTSPGTNAGTESSEHDPRGLFEYYRTLLADPMTGSIPPNIRMLELAYAGKLPVNNEAKRAEELWKARGPNNLGGRTRAFGINIDNHNEVIAGSATGGIFKSTDGGRNWTKTQCPANSITCLIQDQRPGKTNNWYAGTGELTGSSGTANGAYYYGQGIFKSTDNGNTWTVLPSTAGASTTSFDSDFDGVWNIVMDYSNLAETEIYAATYAGIYKTTDGGTIWKKKRSGSLPNFSYYTDVAITTDGIVYATLSSEGTHKGIWRSADGEAWTNILPAGFPSVYGRMTIGIAPSDQNQVYIMASATTNFGFVSTNFLGVKEWNSLWKYDYVSGNGSGTGGTWADRSANLPDKGGDFGYFSTQGGYDLYVKVKPDDPDVVFIGATNLWRSNDGFKTKDQIGWIGGYAVNTFRPDFKMYANHHPDNHNLVFMPGSSVKAYSTHDGGISYTDNITAPAVMWESRINNYITSQFYTVAIDHSSLFDNKIIGGLQDNGTHFIDQYGMGSWHMSLSSDGSFCVIKDGGSEIYASTQQGRIVHLQVDAAGRPLKYARIDPSQLNRDNYDFINPYAIDPNDQKILYLPAKKRLFRNTDIEARPLADIYDSTRWTTPLWEEMTQCVPILNHEFSAITVSGINPNTLYYATDKGKLYKVNNANVGNPVPKDISGPGFGGGNINCISLDPLDSNRIIVVFSNYSMISLFETRDGGQVWNNISGNLEENANGSGSGPSCRWAAVMPLASGKRSWFVATSVGLYATDSLAGLNTSWVLQSPNGIGKNIVTMIDTRPQDYYIVAATHGYGMHSANIASEWQITSIEEIGAARENMRFNAYPNPLTGEILVLNFNRAFESAPRFELMDIHGKTIAGSILSSEKMDAGSYKLLLDHIPPGIYWVRASAGNEKWVEKIVVLK
jgi:photosystem II stability/assembly factor-like uncharacterized protein